MEIWLRFHRRDIHRRCYNFDVTAVTAAAARLIVIDRDIVSRGQWYRPVLRRGPSVRHLEWWSACDWENTGQSWACGPIGQISIVLRE